MELKFPGEVIRGKKLQNFVMTEKIQGKKEEAKRKISQETDQAAWKIKSI